MLKCGIEPTRSQPIANQSCRHVELTCCILRLIHCNPVFCYTKKNQTSTTERNKHLLDEASRLHCASGDGSSTARYLKNNNGKVTNKHAKDDTLCNLKQYALPDNKGCLRQWLGTSYAKNSWKANRYYGPCSIFHPLANELQLWQKKCASLPWVQGTTVLTSPALGWHFRKIFFVFCAHFNSHKMALTVH